MPKLFWLLTGSCATLALVVALLPWWRTRQGFQVLLERSWSRALIVCGFAAVVVAAYLLLRHSPAATSPIASHSPDRAGEFGDAVRAFEQAGRGAGGPEGGTPKSGANSMDSAIANLELRLVKGGGSADDWELLAKSFEFLGRPADAVKARAHQLPPPDSAGTESLISGEVALSAALASKASAGQTLFIIAKSVNSPGAPVAVFRGTVGEWPVKFSLDDSQAMLPERKLSNAGPVMIEARISLRGQPLPATGDMQGSAGPVNPAEHTPLKIIIDYVIP